PVLKAVRDFIKQDAKEKIKSGGSKKVIKEREAVSISALNKMISKLERKKWKPLTQPEEFSLLYNLFNVKRELYDPANDGTWMGLDRQKVEDLMTLIYE
ncbi:MAG: hypothetical protein KGH78_05375, partial [Candidatus Micrarchaeota archaeon]|nr:hypothetical protein [Candidatus Micrarchaeota archaeon]